MYTTEVFIFTQRQIVVLYSGTSSRSYMPVYSKTLTLNKGVDNAIQFQFLNQQQKYVDITSMSITFRILNQNATEVLLKKALTLTLPATGIATLNVTEAEIEELDSQRCYYTLEYTNTSGATNYPVFTDQLAGARGDLVIADSIMPKFLPCENIQIPSGQIFPNSDMYMSQCSVLGLQSTAVSYYSDIVTTYDNPVLTIQLSLVEYSGNVQLQGATTTSDASWYPIDDVYTYTTTTNTVGYNIDGYHPYVRIKFTSYAGAVANIKIR